MSIQSKDGYIANAITAINELLTQFPESIGEFEELAKEILPKMNLSDDLIQSYKKEVYKQRALKVWNQIKEVHKPNKQELDKLIREKKAMKELQRIVEKGCGKDATQKEKNKYHKNYINLTRIQSYLNKRNNGFMVTKKLRLTKSNIFDKISLVVRDDLILIVIHTHKPISCWMMCKDDKIEDWYEGMTENEMAAASYLAKMVKDSVRYQQISPKQQNPMLIQLVWFYKKMQSKKPSRYHFDNYYRNRFEDAIEESTWSEEALFIPILCTENNKLNGKIKWTK
jgi:hypothetical protein